MGEAARATVSSSYSVSAWEGPFVAALTGADPLPGAPRNGPREKDMSGPALAQGTLLAHAGKARRR